MEEEEVDPENGEHSGEAESGQCSKKNDEEKDENENENDNENGDRGPNSGRSCFNKLCGSKKIYRKVRSKVVIGKYRFLCKNCHENYVNNNFC